MKIPAMAWRLFLCPIGFHRWVPLRGSGKECATCDKWIATPWAYDSAKEEYDRLRSIDPDHRDRRFERAVRLPD